MLIVMYLLTRQLFRVGFEWRRLVKLVLCFVGVAVSGEVLLPSEGVTGLLLRVAWMIWIPILLLLSRFFHSNEWAYGRATLARIRSQPPAPRTRGEIDAYSDDPLRDI
jgi:hypothetical protein